jgi:hypothetical protein
MKTKKLRGEDLDKRLIDELEKMISIGPELAPISRAEVFKRLELTSRSTLGTPERLSMIENARLTQLERAGLNRAGKKKRNDFEDKYENLKIKNAELEKQRDNLLEKLAMIINGCQAKGYDLDEIMLPIRV